MGSLSIVDYAVIALYLAATAAIAMRTARRQTTTSEYFIANRRLPFARL